MTFKARPSRISAAGSPSRESFGFARQSAQWLQTMRPGLKRLVGGVLLALTPLAPAVAVTPTAEDGFAPGANAQVVASAIQPDGKIIVGGYFTELQTPGQSNPVAVGYVARINPDGSIDTSFNPMANGVVKAIHLQADGKILIGGYFTSLSPNGGAAVARNRIARLNSDGTVDTTFNAGVGGASAALTHVATIALDSSNRVLIGGEFTTAGPTGGTSTARLRMARLNSDGSLDATFNTAFNNLVAAIAIDSTGRIVVGGGFTTATSSGSTTATARLRLARLSSAGVVDAAYDPSADNLVVALAFQQDGKLIATGNFSSFKPNGATTAESRAFLARILDNGTLDVNFRAGMNSFGEAVAVTPDGKIIVSGAFRAVNATGATASTRADFIARFAADGSIDTTFFPGPSYTVSTFALQSDGKLFIGGYFTDFFPGATNNGIVRRYMARLNEDGSLDASLSPSADRGIFVLTGQTDGQILVGGSFSSLGGITRRSVARMSATGVVDPVFDPSTNGQVVAIATQPDGKVLLGGFFSSLTPNGTTTAVTRNSIARVNADGTLDTAFNPNPNGAVTTIAVQSDGKILIAGSFSSLTPNGATEAVTRGGLARLNADGTVDTTFTPSPNNSISAILVESDGKIIIAGAFSGISYENSSVGILGLARLNADGSVVTTFAPNPNSTVSAARLLPSGKILIGGAFSSLAPVGTTASIARSGIALINADGTVDTAFDPSANNVISTLSVLSDGKILVGGRFTGFKPNGATDARSTRTSIRIPTRGSTPSSAALMAEPSSRASSPPSGRRVARRPSSTGAWQGSHRQAAWTSRSSPRLAPAPAPCAPSFISGMAR
jgi:uncharacterized delta-60 repeat protein